jgi:S1-C subfamily serine protease
VTFPGASVSSGMKAIIALLAAALLCAAGQDGTVGLSAVPIYNDNAPDKQGPAVVVEVLENTPAAKAGIRNGDFIVAINGADVAGKTAARRC